MLSINMGSKRTFILAALAVSLLGAQERTASIAGSAQDEAGGAVADAQVKLRSLDGGAEVQAVSGTDGQFTFKDVKPGAYTLTGVARQGKLMGSLSKVVLTPGNTFTVVLPLKAAQQIPAPPDR